MKFTPRKVFVDGVEIKSVRSITVKHEARDIPHVFLELLVEDVITDEDAYRITTIKFAQEEAQQKT